MKQVSQLEKVKAIKARYEDELLRYRGVQGVGTRSIAGKPVIAVYVGQDADRSLPTEVEGVPVVVEYSGVFEAQ